MSSIDAVNLGDGRQVTLPGGLAEPLGCPCGGIGCPRCWGTAN